MITENDFLSANGYNVWKLVDASHPLKLYVGIDEKGRYSFEFIGSFTHNKNVKSSKIIEINHYKMPANEKSMVLSLIDNSYLKEFCIFCNDLIKSTSRLSKYTNKGYETLCNIYFTWQRMFKSQSGLMDENEIKGMLGELLFLKNDMFPIWGISTSLSSWSGPDSSKKDFSLGTTWYEVKTIDCGKNTVVISSLEQLDSTVDGILVVYQVEKMTSEYNGLTINKVTNDIINMITSLHDKEMFLDKLNKAGYNYSELYDDFVYDVKKQTKYRVDESFPKITKGSVHKAIAKATYEITISDIIDFEM